jgi:3-isopropylmalate dehydrogenase
MPLIAVLPGDGIGPEVTAQAVKVLNAVLHDCPQYEIQQAPIGTTAYDACGEALPSGTLELVRRSSAILFGAVGVPDLRPRQAPVPRGVLLRLRKELKLCANLRPVVMVPELVHASTLKAHVVDGVDILIVREFAGDVYYGRPRGVETNERGERSAFNTMRYSESQVERIGRTAFEAARLRRRKVCSVDKANVLEAMALWRDVITRTGAEFPDVELSHLYVDAAVMALIRDPKQFDVIVSGNLFGDILSDAAAMLTGSIGMMPSASLAADGNKGLYEPIHGTAPELAGKDVANPIASIASAAMMLRHSFGLPEKAVAVEHAVRSILKRGYRTADIAQPGMTLVGTAAMGDLIAAAAAAPEPVTVSS